jgi:hypothetical protein
MRKIIVALMIGAMLASMLAVPAAAADRLTVKVPKIEVAPVIDGKVTEDEWGTPFYAGEIADTDVWQGLDGTEPTTLCPEYIELWTRWDKDYVYFAAKVTEQIHYNLGVDAGGWAGDAIGIDIVPEGVTDQAVRFRTNLSINSKTGQVNPYYHNKPNAALDGRDDFAHKFGDDVNTYGMASVDGKVVTYEWAFGWDFVQPYSDIKEGFKFMTNYQLYCTSDGAMYYIRYATRDDQDALQYPYLVLTAAPKVETTPVTQATTNTGSAPATFDVAVLAGVSAALAAAGVVVSKKRK